MEKEFKPTWLYVKQHNITGLKYFGKTYRKNIKSYFGSGKRWINHINKHGKNHVITLWSELFKSSNEIKEFATAFSEIFNITESPEWANLKPENGLDGGSPGGKLHGFYGKHHSPEARKKISDAVSNRPKIKLTEDHKNKIKTSWSNTRFYGVSSTQEKEDNRLKNLAITTRERASRDWVITSPDNKEYTIKNLVNFCKENNLPYTTLKESSNRKNIITRGLAAGWSVRRP